MCAYEHNPGVIWHELAMLNVTRPNDISSVQSDSRALADLSSRWSLPNRSTDHKNRNPQFQSN